MEESLKLHLKTLLYKEIIHKTRNENRAVERKWTTILRYEIMHSDIKMERVDQNQKTYQNENMTN